MTGPDISQLIAARETLMQDTCTVTRPAVAGQTPDLDDNGMPISTPGDSAVYDHGKCSIKEPQPGKRAGRTTNDESGIPEARILEVPNDSPDFLPGDLVTMNSSRFSPGLVGDLFVVLGEEERSYATYRRYMVRGSAWLSSPS